MAGFQHCDLKLPTLEVSWPVFNTPVALALKLPTLAVVELAQLLLLHEDLTRQLALWWR